MMPQYNSLRQKLLLWFRNTRRPLPWRTSYDPYQVWISEIMLQQTQMERGIEYFNRWVRRFPDAAAVADAEEQEILKYWEGLGYYARARNLHKAAKILVEQYGGEIPCDHGSLLQLPGIGPYTAAAISSIACNIDVPVIDANVTRVYSRLFDIATPVKSSSTKKRVEELAEAILPSGKARLFNQALMDLGGLVCLPRNPKCTECPLSESCLALLRDCVAMRPVTGDPQKTTLIEMATGLLEYEGKLFIQQRLADDIWGGLWEFPGGSLKNGESGAEAVVREYREETGFTVQVCSQFKTITHYYTRYKVVLYCYGCRLLGEPLAPELTAAQQYRWVLADNLSEYAFPAGHRMLIDHLRQEHSYLLADPCWQEEDDGR